MADWSTLPGDLIHLISQRISTSTDLLRFRSVCPAWRSAAQLPPTFGPRLPNSFPCPKGWSFQLLKCTLYCIESHLPDHSSWIVKLYRENRTRMHLIHSLSRFQFQPLSNNFPKCLNTLNFRVKELCEEYTIRYENPGAIRMEKVAVLNDPRAGYVLLTIHISGKLLVCDERCSFVEVEDRPTQYEDLIVREGRFYAVDMNGRLLFVDHVDLKVSVVVDSISGGHKKFLVNSNGELLLVNLYWGQAAVVGYDKIVKFKVFRLDENVGKWVEVNDLGNRILFLGENCILSGESCIFSVSASEIFHKDDPCDRGNCIVFDDWYYFFPEDGELESMSVGVGVFDLESGIINGPICRNVCYSKMLWPPPDWIRPSASVEVRESELIHDALKDLVI